MKNCRIILFLILVLFVQNLNAQEVKKPADVFEMYFGLFVKNDKTAITNLNDYLRPTVNGEDAYQIDFKAASDEMLNSGTEAFLSPFSKNTADACKKEAEDYFRTMFDNFRNAKLTIKNIKLVQNEYIENEKIAEVSYTVSFKVPSKMTDLPTAEIKKIKAEELKNYLIKVTEELKNPDKLITIEQEFSLYELKEKDKIYYWNGSPDQIVTSLTDFYFDNFGSK